MYTPQFGRYVVVGHRTGGIFSFSQSIFSNERVSNAEIGAKLSASGYGTEAKFESSISVLRTTKSVNVQQQDYISSQLYTGPDGSKCDMSTLTGASACADLWRSTGNPSPPNSAYYAYAVPYSILKPYQVQWVQRGALIMRPSDTHARVCRHCLLALP